MKKNRKKPREAQIPLKESLEKRLSVYALAAGAAGMVGVGALAFPPPAEASIITTTNFTTVLGSLGHSYFLGNSFKYSNGAAFPYGEPILGFVANSTSLLARTATGFPDVMVGSGSVLGDASIPKLGPGAPIGPTGAFASFGILEGRTSKGSLVGNWTGTRAGYIGLSFFGGAFFGWALVSNSATASGKFNMNVIEAAIDLTPGQTIKAGQTAPVPEPPTLALLALGAVGLFALRKKRQAAAERESAANG